MRPDRQTLLHNLPALVTFLTGETGVHSNDLMTSSCSPIFKDIKELTPAGVENALGQMVIFHHSGNLQVFNGKVMIAFSIRFCGLEMVISALPVDLEMRLGNVLGSLTPSVAAFLAAAHGALLPSECPLRGAIKARVLNSVPFRVGQEGLEPDIKANVRVLTCTWQMLMLWLCFADNQGIPMPIGTQHEVNRLGSALDRAMQFDLEEVPHLLRDDQVVLILVQIAILAVLPEWDGMPSVGLFEAREPNTRDVILFGDKEPLERFGETISEHLYRGGWHVFTFPFECRFKLILAWERSISLILCLDHLKHPIVNGARLSQACHEFTGLFLLHEQAVFKRFHRHVLQQTIRIVKGARMYPRADPICLSAFAKADA